MTQLQGLIAMDKLLSDRSKWTKGWFARDRQNKMLDLPQDANACKWCLLGAAYRLEVPNAAVRRLENLCHGLSLVIWNDQPTREFSEVKSLLARAIAAVRKTKRKAVK